MIIDTHAHIDDKAFESDRIDIINKALESEIKLIINPASSFKSNERIIKLNKEYPFILPAFGVHPHEADTLTKNNLNKLRDFINYQRPIAIGETGLDFHYNFSPPDTQKEAFVKQIELSIEYDLPLIIHCRKAEETVFKTISIYKNLKGVIHCFSGNSEYAKKFTSLGFFLGITGVVTFKKSEELKNIVRETDLNFLLAETDSPYLSPVPFRGKRNEPSYVKFITEEIARIKEIDLKTAENTLFNNAKTCFRGITLP